MKREQAAKSIERERERETMCVSEVHPHTLTNDLSNWKHYDDHDHDDDDDDDDDNGHIINHPMHPSAYEMMKM